MARQIGDIKITGTIDDITFYRMEGQYYARRKSSLEGKRVKRDPRFRRTMEWAHRLGRASQLASKIYRSLPRPEQVYALYKELKSLALRGLKEGKSEAEVGMQLQQRVGRVERPLTPALAKPKKTRFVRPSFPSTVLSISLQGRGRSGPGRRAERLWAEKSMVAGGTHRGGEYFVTSMGQNLPPPCSPSLFSPSTSGAPKPSAYRSHWTKTWNTRSARSRASNGAARIKCGTYP